jgi:hypothetical protein
MNSSILTFPDRGPWGDNRYRGNCSGHIIRALLQYFKPRIYVDPAEGGGTSRDVAKLFPDMQYYGFDLSKGFNLLRDRLIARLPREADYVFFHPPYHDIIHYSGNMWGTPHQDDLSRCSTKQEFIEKLQLALHNIYEAVRPGGNYSVLIGDVRRNGDYWSIQSDIIQVAPGKLDGVLVKGQHNCVSDSTEYSGRFIPIRHEYLINMRKDRTVFAVLDQAVSSSSHLSMLSNANWRAVIERALRRLGGKATLPEIYGAVKQFASEKTVRNPHWEAKVRQTLQKHCQNVERGVWQMPDAQQAA